MQTPAKYWRLPLFAVATETTPASQVRLPHVLASQASPPAVGHGVLLAGYDEDGRTGIVRHVGLVTRAAGATIDVNWRATHTEIWVDTDQGDFYWKKPGGFAFARTKIVDYGLPELFVAHFDGMTFRSTQSTAGRPRTSSTSRSFSRVSSERLTPIEMVGSPTDSEKGGYVYVLQSAYGFKVGRTRRLPDRMRTFGVKLPFMYTIPLCAWFDDHFTAETSYHQLFRDKRINGEWFALDEQDIALIRTRQLKGT